MTEVVLTPKVVAARHVEEGLLATQNVKNAADRFERHVRGKVLACLRDNELYVDPGAIKVRWTCEVEVFGYEMPEGFIDPDLPPEDQARLREKWFEIVQKAESLRQSGVPEVVVSVR